MNDAVQEDRPLYSSRITNNYITLIQHKYSHINVNELLRSAGIKPFQVEDEGHWFTQKQIKSVPSWTVQGGKNDPFPFCRKNTIRNLVFSKTILILFTITK